MATSLQECDVIVWGAGPAGYVCAIRLAQLGRKVTVVDRDTVGGVCLNRGCIPSKALIYAGTLYEKMLHAKDMGIEVQGAKINPSKLVQWKDGVVTKLTGGIKQLLTANGCTIVKGDAKLVSQDTLEIDGKLKLKFKSLVIATGSRPTDMSPKIPGLKVNHKNILDSTSALAQTDKIKTLLCVGGGYIGLELGTFYAKIGTKVTVVEAMPRLLSGVDPDLLGPVMKGLATRGVDVLLSHSVKSVTDGKSGVTVAIADEKGKEKSLNFEKILVTVGRTPNTDGIGLEKAAIELDSKGFIVVDAQRKTKAPGIWAIGDVAGQPLLAHKGSKEGMVAAEAIAGKKTRYDVVAMPAVIFVDPEIATVGMTEAEAKAAGIATQVGIFPFAANGRALSVSEPAGMVKVVGDGKTGRLLGVHIVGAEASNLIAEATLAIEMGAHVEDLALTVHAHPTLPETLMEAAEAALGHAIHIFKPKSKSEKSVTA